MGDEVDRKTYLGGGDIASVAGVSSYSGPHETYLAKRGLAKPVEDTGALEWGLLLEEPIAKKYAATKGVELIHSPYLRHSKLDFVGGHPDRLVVGQEKLLEIKTAGLRMAHLWGEPGTDQIPMEYLCQVAWYLAITNLPVADVAVLIGGQDFRVFHVERDMALEERLLELAARFWRDHVVPGVPPPIDASESARRYLSGAYPREASPVIDPADNEEIALAVGLRLARAEHRRAEEERRRFENLIKQRLQNRAGIEGEDFKITWKRTRDGETVNWESLAKGLLKGHDKQTADNLISINTIKREGHRRFLAKFKGEDTDDE